MTKLPLGGKLFLIQLLDVLPIIQGYYHCLRYSSLEINFYINFGAREEVLLRLCPIDVATNRVTDASKGITAPVV
jgi:hypothetical protein